MKKVIITGCAGFIGSNLTEACLGKGWHVVGVDNLSTGYDEMADPIRYVSLSGRYEFLNADINDTNKMKGAFVGADIIFHLAALPRVSYSIDKPISANLANVSGTLSVLEAARKAKAKRVIFSCSSSVYGGVSSFPTTEDSRSHPLSPYALHKEAGAEYCRIYSQLHGLETCSLIYFNVYGPHQRADSAYATVIPAFFKAAVDGGSCRIDGSGTQSRDFCSVENVVHANILAAEYSGRLLGDRYNIANGETHSVKEVYQIINNEFGGSLKFHNAPARLGDPHKSHACIKKAKRELGYEPIVGFLDGMKKTAGWWRNGCPIII